jgi:hypothetical protein
MRLWQARTMFLRFASLVLLAGACATPLFPQDKVRRPEPKADNVLPIDPVALITTIRQNQKQIEAARKDYIFHCKDEEWETDSEGHKKSSQIKEYEAYFVGPWEIDRLLSKNGKPLTEGESKKQDDEVRKQEAKARERLAKRESGEDPGKNTITLPKFLAADHFYNLRRDTYQGREVFAMDFAPRPDFRPHSLVDKVLKAMGGTLWIDEQAKQIVRMEARFLEGLKMGAGLAGSVQKGGNVVFEQRFVNDEIWMPSYGEIHLDARVLFVHKSVNVASTYNDYRKFRVDSKLSSGTQPTPVQKP